MKHKTCEKCAGSVGLVNVLGNIMMILLKGYIGVVGGSKALIADAIHSSADLLATLIMIIGLRVSSRTADEKFPYGYGKSEYVVAIAIYIFLFMIGTYILIDGVRVIFSGRMSIPSFLAIWGAVFSITINELMFRLTICAGTQVGSPSMVAKAWESRSDVYSSAAVLIGIVGSRLGFPFMDPLAAIVVGLIILRICVQMVTGSVKKLLDQALEEDLVEKVHETLSSVADIVRIRKILGWEAGRKVEFEIKLEVPAKMSLSASEKVKREAKKAIEKVIERPSSIRIRLYPAKVGFNEAG